MQKQVEYAEAVKTKYPEQIVNTEPKKRLYTVAPGHKLGPAL
jgi:hypothetical protein